MISLAYVSKLAAAMLLLKKYILDLFKSLLLNLQHIFSTQTFSRFLAGFLEVSWSVSMCWYYRT